MNRKLSKFIILLLVVILSVSFVNALRGDGIADPGEQCDIDEFGNVAYHRSWNCRDFGYSFGQIECSGGDVSRSLCEPEIPQGVCGNGILEIGEECDGIVGYDTSINRAMLTNVVYRPGLTCENFGMVGGPFTGDDSCRPPIPIRSGDESSWCKVSAGIASNCEFPSGVSFSELFYLIDMSLKIGEIKSNGDVRIDLVLNSGATIELPFSGLQAIVSWNPNELSFIKKDDSCGSTCSYNAMSSFFNRLSNEFDWEAGSEDINANLNDGDFMYTAFAPLPIVIASYLTPEELEAARREYINRRIYIGDDDFRAVSFWFRPRQSGSFTINLEGSRSANYLIHYGSGVSPAYLRGTTAQKVYTWKSAVVDPINPGLNIIGSLNGVTFDAIGGSGGIIEPQPEEVECYYHSECNQGANIRGICTFPGKTYSRCVYVSIPSSIICRTNNDCNDGQSNTRDICVNPDTLNSRCEYETIVVLPGPGPGPGPSGLNVDMSLELFSSRYVVGQEVLIDLILDSSDLAIGQPITGVEAIFSWDPSELRWDGRRESNEYEWGSEIVENEVEVDNQKVLRYLATATLGTNVLVTNDLKVVTFVFIPLSAASGKDVTVGLLTNAGEWSSKVVDRTNPGLSLTGNVAGITFNVEGATGVPPTVCIDFDNDGYDNCNIGEAGDDGKFLDCNDNDNLEFPGQQWFRDVDNDNYGSGSAIFSCLRPIKYKAVIEFTSTSRDCDDDIADDPTICNDRLNRPIDCSIDNYLACAECINPGAQEICDNLDNNCNNEIDEGNVCIGDTVPTIGFPPLSDTRPETQPDTDESRFGRFLFCLDKRPQPIGLIDILSCAFEG